MGTTADKLNKVLQTKEAIRTAINNKGGTLTETDTFASYATAINNIQSGSANEPITITQNGTYTAPEGTGYSPINVNVPSKEEETKSITITENGTTTVLPTSGKVLSKVDIVANVPQSGGGDNPLQYVIDNQGGNGKPSCYNLFINYKGTNLDDVLSQCDFSKVTNMGSMFNYCSNLTSIPLFNTSSCTNMDNMFANCTYLTTVPQLNTSQVTEMNNMFDRCSKLTTIPVLDTSKVTNMRAMFTYCQKLTTIPQLDTSKVTNIGFMFYNCSKLTTIPQLDTSSCTNMDNMFASCSELTEVPSLNTSKCVSFQSMFYQCYKLKRISELDLTSARTFNTYVFSYCQALTYLKLLNIKLNIQIGSGTSWGHLIEKDCLIQIISELIDTGSSKTLTMGTANKAKIADTYVKLLADDGTGKHPFEVCESTDEGAMTIEAYCNSKNWTLA